VTVRAWTVTDPLEVSDELLGAAAGAALYIALEVSDDGGMAPETVERIFDPFFTTKPTGHASDSRRCSAP
jgi:signal transduction histidine kinase